MGFGQLKDAALRERRHRLLGADMVAAVRRPSRAQLGVLVDGERQTHSHLAATVASEEKRGLETLMMGRPTNPLHTSPTVAGKFMMESPCKLGNMLDASPIHHSCGMHDPVKVEGLLCSNAPSEIRPHAQLIGGALIDGERRTHRRAATTTSGEVVGLQQVKQQSVRRRCPGPAEEDFLLQVQVEGPLCSNVGSESRRPHAQRSGAALVDGGCQIYYRAITSTSQETRGSETLMTGFSTSALRSSSAVAGIGKTMVEHTLIHRSHGMSDPTETHRRAAIAPSEDADGLETLIPSQDSDSDGNDSMMMPIFVRHGSGELTFTIRMDQSINDLMQLYAQKTKTKLDSQYFVYERKRLEPHHSWLSYGLKRDTTVHVCTRLLGGANDPNLEDYINNNKHKFVQVVPLPDGRASIQMTRLGCQFLSSWINCFTTAFIASRSWNGEFELVDFIFTQGHVRSKTKPSRHTKKPGSLAADITKFVKEVESILLFSDMQNVVSNHPPYVEACLRILSGLVAPGVTGPLAAVTGPLPNEYKLLLDTLVCCMTSYARERLIIELFRKYEGADKNEASLWKSAINAAPCPPTWRADLSTSAMFNDFIQKKISAGKPYPKDKTGAFTLLRDVVMHAADCSENANAPELADGIELMIPANKHLNEFLPYIIKNLIEEKIDLSAELSAAIRCACNICDS